MTEPNSTQVQAEETAGEKSVGRSAAMMSALVIVSRITGFFRTWGQAFALGATGLSSVYTTANNLPNQLYELVMGGMIATAFLPVYLSLKKRSGREASNRYASNLVSLVMILMGAITILGFVFARQAIWTQAFNAKEGFDFDLSVFLFRFFVIECILYALSSIISGLLNAERDYFWSQAAPIFNNLVCIASFFGYYVLQGSNPTLAILSLAIGNPLGVLVQVLMQVPSLRRNGIRLRPYVDIHDPAIRETLSIGIPSLVVTICSFVTFSVQNSSALSVSVAGSSIAYYTRTWYTLPYSVFAIPITTAMFTELSDSVAKGDMSAYTRGVSYGTSRILFMLIPFTMYLVVFSRPLINIMAAGNFSEENLVLTSEYLAVLALSLPMYGVCTYLQKVCSSLRRMNLYAVSIVIGSILQVAFCLILTPVFGLMMVALSSLFFFTLVDIVTFLNLRKHLGYMGLRAVASTTVKSLLLGAAGSAVGIGILLLLQTFAGPMAGVMRSLIYTLAAGIPAVLVTFGLAIALKMPEASTFTSLVDRLLPGHKGR